LAVKPKAKRRLARLVHGAGIATRDAAAVRTQRGGRRARKLLGNAAARLGRFAARLGGRAGRTIDPETRARLAAEASALAADLRGLRAVLAI
jgi:hypothetical protein